VPRSARASALQRRHETTGHTSSAAGSTWANGVRHCTQPRTGSCQDAAIEPPSGRAGRGRREPRPADGLWEQGYVEGENILIEYRTGDDQQSRLAEHAAELVQLPVDVIVAPIASAEVAREATSTIPIVMVYPADPVASGLVASLARPRGNITGLTYLAGQLGQKRLGLLKESLPSLARVAVLQEGDRPTIARDFQDLESAAQLLRVELQRLDVRDPGEDDAAFEAAMAGRADGLLLGGGGFFMPDRSRVVELAAQHRLPTMYFTPIFVHAGGLMAYA
jgi:putative tryptophan/tyrosine transport system substrate-binding protein